MIDLHLHTTASDGRSAPADLVREAIAAGLTTIAVTDHDTLAGQAEVQAAARDAGVRTVTGIEITAVHESRDVHVLAYFVAEDHDELAAFLTRQRETRRQRLLVMMERLARAGAPIDTAAIHRRAAESGRSLGRPLLADALIEAGHVSSRAEAFERYLSQGRPAYVPRDGATPAQVIEIVARAGGIASLAHPGKLHRDELIPKMVEAGLPAIEVHHPDHDRVDTNRYRRVAEMYGLLVTGGSDYHGPGSGRTGGLGRVTLPADDFERLVQAHDAR